MMPFKDYMSLFNSTMSISGAGYDDEDFDNQVFQDLTGVHSFSLQKKTDEKGCISDFYVTLVLERPSKCRIFVAQQTSKGLKFVTGTFEQD